MTGITGEKPERPESLNDQKAETTRKPKQPESQNGQKAGTSWKAGATEMSLRQYIDVAMPPAPKGNPILFGPPILLAQNCLVH